MANLFPVALCHGVAGWGREEMNAGWISLPYWGYATQDDLVSPGQNSQKVPGQLIIECSVGPFSSFHDRACELVAQIRGTKTDYGAAHASANNHNRYGQDFTGKGKYPQWSASNPIHLVGHSMGAGTIRMAQYLLATNYWGFGSNASWVKSISSISGVMNGSTLTYYLGCNKVTGSANGIITSFLLAIINAFESLTGGLFDGVYDLDLSHWNLTRNPGESIESFCARIQSQTKFGANNDNGAYDLTIQGCDVLNTKIPTYANTHYFSYITEETGAGIFPYNDYQYIDADMSPILGILSGNFMGTLNNNYFATAPIPGWGSGDKVLSKWREHDGAVPSISQRYPWTSGTHPVGGPIKGKSTFVPGKWHFDKVQTLVGFSWDHLDVCTTPATEPLSIPANKKFYKDMYARLASL